jgi:diguanylate cyclase (GGDEF)-like protein
MAEFQRSGGRDTEDLIRLSYFTDIARAIAETTSLRETLDEVMHQIGRVFAPRNWSLLLKNPKTGELTFTVVIGSNELASELQGTKVPRGQGIAGWIAEHGEPLIIEDVESDDRFDSSIDERLNFKTHSIIGVPLKSGDRVFGVIELINKLDGEHFTPLDLKLLSTIADFTAIAVQKAYYIKALRKIATIDHLTGVYNRRSCMRILDREIARCHRHGSSLSTLILDIDHFKEINDTHGHAAGDRVLLSLAQLAARCIRRVDYICRYGGDEFVMVLPDTAPGAADHVRQRIQDALREQNEQNQIPYSVSIGAFSGCPESSTELLDRADVQLYKQKQPRRAGSSTAEGSLDGGPDSTTHSGSNTADQVGQETEQTIEQVSEHIGEFFEEDADT